MPPTVRGVHLVGSIPLPTTLEVFRKVASALPHRLRRIPDGETGSRGNFAAWQAPIIGRWDVVLNPLIRRYLKLPNPELPQYTEDEKKRVIEEMEEGLETQYDVVALESYQVFKRMKEEGVIPRDVRFLVALPSPVTVTALFVREGFQAEFEGVYEKALGKALERIQKQIPREELAIQWDCPLEMGMLDGVNLPDRDTEKWWEGPMLGGSAGRLARVCDMVGEGVELGVHLCYGDMKGKHFIDPKTAGSLVSMAKGVLDRCKRQVDFLHLPVPKDRMDDAYFEPLGGLGEYVRQGHELCLGLLHSDDLEGTQERIRVAGKFIPAFSVASECGMGRQSQEAFGSLLEIAVAVSEPLEAAREQSQSQKL